MSLSQIKINYKDIEIVYIWYFLIPIPLYFLFEIYNIKPKIFFDFFLLLTGLCSLLIVLLKGKISNKKIVFTLFFFSFFLFNVFLIKQSNFYVNDSWARIQYFGPFVREVKPLIYFFLAAIFIAAFRLPTVESFVKAGALLSVLIVSDFIFDFFVLGDFSQRPHILDESNYDNFLVLVSLIALFLCTPVRFWRYYSLFLLVTLMSQSKTGIGTFFVLSALFFILDCRYSKYKYIFLGIGVICTPVVSLIIYNRLSSIESFEEIDRIRMWFVFFDYLKDATIPQLLFGQTPGVEILSYDTRLDGFIKLQTEAINAEGLHPFNLHGFLPRFISSWGLIPLSLYLLLVLYFVRTTKATKYIFTLIVLQGFSLGIIYLSTVSFIFILFLTVVFKEYKTVTIVN